jgi:hypothetical protein
MDGGARSSHPSSSGSFFSFVLSLEDMRSKKDLAEDWLGDKDGILLFVRHTRLSPQSHIMRDLFPSLKSVWTFLGIGSRVHHRRQ